MRSLFSFFLMIALMINQPVMAKGKFDTTAKIGMYRESAGMLHAGKSPFSVIEDRGALTRALKADSGNYIFSEKGVGVQPLVMVGTLPQIFTKIADEAALGTKIVNKIDDLPDIYIGIAPYKPGKRFKCIYPTHDIAKQIILSLIDFTLPVNDLPVVKFSSTEAISNLGTLATTLYDIQRQRRVHHKKRGLDEQVLYVKFGYLQEDGMEKIGAKEISFAELGSILTDALRKSAAELAPSKK